MRAGRAGDGWSDVATRAVAAGLVGLQLWTMPLVGIPSSRIGSTLPRLDMVEAAAAASQRGWSSAPSSPPLATEEDLIGGFVRLFRASVSHGGLVVRAIWLGAALVVEPIGT